jgi:hypothetical protein
MAATIPPRGRGRGRPVFPKGQAKSAALRIRLSPGEMSTLRRLARELGVTMSDVVRERVFGDEVT